MSALLTADWFQLDTYYRKFDLYTMNWMMDEGLENMIVSGAPYGGPMAVVRDRKQFVQIKTTTKPVITIYNCSGNVISKILWNSGVLLHIGWSDGEQLLCIQESGDVLIYDMFGAYQKTFNMGQEVRDTKVCKAQLFPNPHGIGLAVITTTNRMFLVSNVSEPKARPVPDIPRANEPISCWCAVNSSFIVCRDKEIYKCQLGESRAILLRPEIKNPYTQILSIVASQNGKHIAFFTDSGFLWIGSSDLRNNYCELDTDYIKQPKEFMWCGSQAVAAHWDDTLCMYGTKGNSVAYPYDGPFHLIQEMDCIRIVSEMTHELVQKVPFVVEKIFRINSTAPGSYLVEASKQFQKRSHRADEYIRLVKPDLSAAVADCIEAAAFEFSPDVQKMLIRAAQFGKCFLMDPVITELYVKTCRWLRVLNAVRDPKVAIPLTSMQMRNLGERILLDRLIWRRLHCLAGHIASYLQLKDGRTRVLSHWACYKVTQPHLDNESAAREIGEKLRNVPGISYTTIAMKAAEKGRKALAIKILEYEAHSKLQVPLLLSLGEGPTALLKATASGDTDLVYVVLLHLKEKMGKHDFELTIRSFPLAHALYIKYCASHNREALRLVYVQEDDFQGQAATHICDAIEQTNPGSAEASLISARECYKKGKNELGASVCEDARKLCKQQSSLQETYGTSFVGLSLHDTVKKLLDQGEVRLADKLRSEYKMPDRRYWWLRILTLAEKSNWEELDKFSKSKKSPVGYEPFVDACLKYNKADEALKYLPRCRDEIKIKYYVKAGYYAEAAEVAYEQKDEAGLHFVQNKCPMQDFDNQAKISGLLEQLKIKK
ncbi:vacuolar protein sorting-associated protein 16 homolog [Bombyx mori]|uniref:Vacuolar protein sorting-associated protein 16 homolog n=1 Tax=Bombyx mori TaxID=7091 RepID=A0A8R2GBR7_BOMMO|nr:vacuolar protein sorting-associated protein 16 homolog [Bombyx mori]XP_012549681.1 vacuolar protein sorting-associated protein 16 homolog [Bombyx mori]XP_021206534.1 vacuolar protein sorting-associated protein 16 homolog [Bombyx mori]XP_021206535.1 vacuolar protein sorting-associated protein 16 homolog [Bombyx mori]XP_037867411.1 vacuolar protein sorting-associated protein 16 homolog [Bombyx mori]